MQYSRGVFFLGLQPIINTPIPMMTQAGGQIHLKCSIMSRVVDSAVEAELEGLFENCQRPSQYEPPYKK